MPRSAPTPKYAAATPPPVVSGRWLLKGIGIVILVALVCSYLCLCLLYYVGQWQIVLHPDRAAQTQEAPPGLIRFGPDESGRPQLTGEWLSAGEDSRYGNLTVLLLPAGDGSRNDLQPIAHTLHNLGLNVFNFDYRGYGLSSAVHPSQQHMTEDSETAWRYLTASRNIPAGKIVPFGVGAGASLAARLAVEHPETPAVIFDRPHTDLLDFARADRRSSLLPAGLLFHENFPLATPLSTLTTPKLLIAKTGEPQPAFASAATPRMTIELPTDDGPLFQETLRRFLDQYAAQDK